MVIRKSICRSNNPKPPLHHIYSYVLDLFLPKRFVVYVLPVYIVFGYFFDQAFVPRYASSIPVAAEIRESSRYVGGGFRQVGFSLASSPGTRWRLRVATPVTSAIRWRLRVVLHNHDKWQSAKRFHSTLYTSKTLIYANSYKY